MNGLMMRLSILMTVLILGVACEQKVDEPANDGYPKSGAIGANNEALPTTSSAQAPSRADSIALPSKGPEAKAERSLDWKTIESTPFSTVSIDVDTASYARSRAAIKSGGRPDSGRVRAEDFLNYFPYEYAAPTDDSLIKLQQQLVASPWTEGAQILALGLKAKDLGLVDPPRNLVFLVDVSGSMASEDKLPLVKASLQTLTDTLRPEDHIALVTYAGYTEVVLNATAGSEKAQIKQAIQKLGAGGGTDGGAGINRAYEIAQKQFVAQGVNRVILTTDGDFNLGVTNSEELVKLIRTKAEAGIFLTILGYGVDGNDALMESVARDANGNYFFIDSTREIEKVFGSDLKGNIVTVAKDVKVQIEFNPRLVKSYRLIGYAERVLKDDEFNQDARDAGDMGSGQTVTYLYEIMPRPAGEAFTSSYQAAAGVDPLIYQSPTGLSEAAAREEIGTFKLRYKTPEAALSQKQDEVLTPNLIAQPSIDTLWQLAVAEAALVIGDIKGVGQASLAAARTRASSAIGADSLGARAEFIALLDRLINPKPGSISLLSP